jgi:hypothetical protein
VGWLTFMEIANVAAYYGGGFIKSRFDTGIVAGRAEAREFNNNFRNIQCRYGYKAINLVAGSGSSWDNIYLLSSSGSTYTKTATSAIAVSTFLNNTTFNRLNVEWSSFTGPMFDLTAAEILFTGFHMEGIDIPYVASAQRGLVKIAGGKITFINSLLMNLHASWGSLTSLGIFEISGSVETSLSLIDVRFLTFNELGGYKFLRYIDNAGGAWRLFAANINEIDIEFDATSPSWYGMSQYPQGAAKQLWLTEHFTSVPSATKAGQLDIFTNGSPAAPAVSAASPGSRPGMISIASGTTEFIATLLQSKAIVRVGSGTVIIRCGFAVSAIPAASTDYERLIIGLSGDQSAAAQNISSNLIALVADYGTFGDNRLALRTLNAGASTSTTLLTLVAGTYYDVEIVLNADGTQVRAFTGTQRITGSSVNNTTNIPLSSVDLYAQVQFVKRGSAPATNRTLTLDYFELIQSPNGKNG